MILDFSLIIPVYHTPEKYIQECVDSILTNQKAKYEILLVNDGSGEELCAYLKELAEKSPCIKVLSQSHGGVSRARNRGTLEASGRYVSYVDADDFLPPGMLDDVLPMLCRYEPDLLITQISRDKRSDSAEGELEAGGEELKNALRRYYLTLKHPRWRSRGKWLNRAPHGRFVRRKLAMDSMFQEDVAFGEDVLWNFALLNSASRVLLYLRQGYCYRWSRFSVTQSFHENFPEEIRLLSECYQRELRTWPEELWPLYDVSFIEYFTILMRVYVMGRPDGRSRERYREEISRKFWKDIFRRVSLRELSGKYLLVALLGKKEWYRLLYFIFALHHRQKLRGQLWKHME